MTPTLNLTSAGGVVVRRVDDTWQALVLHRIRPDEWRLPKGKIHQDESLEQTALREVAEEAGVQPTVVCYLCATSYTYDARREGHVCKTVHYFLMSVPPEANLTLETHNFDTALWLPLMDAISRLSFESEREAVRAALPRLSAIPLR